MASSDKDKKLLEKLLTEWNAVNDSFAKLEDQHAEYIKQLNNLHKAQSGCAKSVKEQRRQMSQLKESLKKFNAFVVNLDEVLPEASMQIRDITDEILEQKARLDDMGEQLPKDNNGLYLNVVLGNINVSLINKADKFRYKDEYEKFKMTVTVITMGVAFVCLLLHFRVVDAVFHFLLVWYYCTLTIRESILRVNGSRIKGWWVLHHYLSAILCGCLLTWPDGSCYRSFRKQFIIFSLYLTLVQLIQCQYQRGCLYRLRALGKRHSMDITVEGFHSWMFRGLTFVLPFLFFGYMFQMYNAYTLLTIYLLPECQKQWQVLAVSVLFGVLAVGNTLTTGQVIFRKYREQEKVTARIRLVTKYQEGDEPDGAKEKSQ